MSLISIQLFCYAEKLHFNILMKNGNFNLHTKFKTFRRYCFLTKIQDCIVATVTRLYFTGRNDVHQLHSWLMTFICVPNLVQIRLSVTDMDLSLFCKMVAAVTLDFWQKMACFNICSIKNGQFNLHAKSCLYILNCSGYSDFLIISSSSCWLHFCSCAFFKNTVVGRCRYATARVGMLTQAEYRHTLIRALIVWWRRGNLHPSDGKSSEHELQPALYYLWFSLLFRLYRQVVPELMGRKRK